MSDERVASAMLSSIRLDDDKEVAKSDSEIEEKHEKVVKRELDLVVSAFKATNGCANHPVFVGFLNRLVETLTEEQGSEPNGSESLLPSLYHGGLIKAMRYSVSDRGWRTVLAMPAKIVCKIVIQHGQCHLGIYDASGNPVLSGYIIAKQKNTDNLVIQDIGDRSLKFPIQNQAQSERSGHIPGGTMQSWCLTLRDEAERIIFKTAYYHASEHNANIEERENSEASSISSQNGTEDGSTSTEKDDSSDDSEATAANLEPASGLVSAATNHESDDTSASQLDDKSTSADDATSESDSDELVSLPETQDIFSQNRCFA